jgi:tRNA-dihydrouridine synthase B
MGEGVGLRHARKHLAAYAEAEGAPPHVRRELVTTVDVATARRTLASVFDPRNDDAKAAA